MKKEITIYELLGLIKDKKAPKRVKYKDSFWDFEKQFNDYYNYMNYLIGDQINFWEDVKLFLEEKVEMIEERPEHIEKLSIGVLDEKNMSATEKRIARRTNLLSGKISELVKAVNYLLEKEK